MLNDMYAQRNDMVDCDPRVFPGNPMHEPMPKYMTMEAYDMITRRSTKTAPKVYIVGSLRNPEVPRIADFIREHAQVEVFDDWYAAGPNADDHWRDYEKARGRTFREALTGKAAKNVYAFDRRFLEAATHVLLVCPAGKSGHLELGWAAGQGKRTAVLLETGVDRWDVMYQFADKVFEDKKELLEWLK